MSIHHLSLITAVALSNLLLTAPQNALVSRQVSPRTVGALADSRRTVAYTAKKIKKYKPSKIKKYKAPKINRKSNRIR